MEKRIFIEFTKPKNKRFPIFSWLIRLFQATEYSHVRLRWISSTGVQVIYEASGASIKLIGELAAQTHQVEVIHAFEVLVSKEEYRNTIRLFRFAGLKYSAKQILGIALQVLLGGRKNRFADGRKAQICSELVGVFLKDVKNLELGYDLDTAGPKEIYYSLADTLATGVSWLKQIK